ncbi:peptide ABC transporter substrate-binding protein [Allostella humosa]|nr:ABC transporter substrate-binding protein [Stella humosa]BBK34870.1 peptide ABC transporter substrate-binding protein [Stella humosa]
MLAAAPAHSQELRIAMQVETTSLDPHFTSQTANANAAAHVFSALVERDEQLRVIPGLATDWSLIGEDVWEFRLRRGVRFHDGGEMTAEDVKASIERVAAVPNSPSPLTVHTRRIQRVEIVDPYTVRLHTDGPAPLTPINISSIAIMSKKAIAAVATDEHRAGPLFATSEQISAGQGAVGTGPFRLVEWKRGERLVLERFDQYFGEKPDWQRVTILPIANNAARVAALLSGQVDLIDYVPLTDIAGLKRNPRLALTDAVTTRIIFLAMDRHRDQPPLFTDRNGAPLGRNPFHDLRVRQAIAKAIDRRALVERVMEGHAVATGQIVPEGFAGYSPALAADGHDPAGARRLLAEAGYPDGFGITLHAPRNRYPNDAQLAQAVGQMLARVGIATNVVAVPPAAFFPASARLEYSFLLTGYGIVTGEPSSFLTFGLLTWDQERGRGSGNRGRYSNPALDRLYDQALATADPARSEDILRQATRVAVEDVGFVPLLHNLHSWAMRADLRYPGRTDEYTLAQFVRRR